MAGEISIGDAAVQRATGRDWHAWFALLDRWGAMRHGHTATARWLHDEHELSGWWSQMVTVQYERERGLRAVHQKANGWSVNVSRTIPASMARAFEAFTATPHARRWWGRGYASDLEPGGAWRGPGGARGAYRAVRPPRALRFTWEHAKLAPGSVVEVRFAARGRGRSTVTLQHDRLPDRTVHSTLKRTWSEALDAFRAYVEAGTGPAARVRRPAKRIEKRDPAPHKPERKAPGRKPSPSRRKKK